MVYMTRTHGFYSIYTNIQWNSCHFPTELVQMFQLINVWNFATIHHLLQCSQSVSAGRSAGTSFTPHCCLPALKCAGVLWTGKLAAKQPESGWLCSLGALQQMVYRRKISHIDQLRCVLIDCWAQLSQDTLNRAIDQLPKRLMMVTKAKGAHAEFRLD